MALALTRLIAPSGHANELITNGGFETGDFTGWSLFDQAGGDGSFFVDNTTSTPISGSPTVGPAGGSFYAVSDQGGPGAHVLLQSFTINPGSTAILSFSMFVNDQSGVGPIVNPAGLDYTADPNQHARVDILAAGADPFSTNPADVLANFYLNVDPFNNPNPYTDYSFDLTGLVGAGGTFLLRFAEVDNQFFLNQGVDNVSINASPAGVPESGSTVLLLGAGLLGMAGIRRLLPSRA
ncbi:MAG: VPDSG-CTERM sorting domain-containing protein [Chthoniobacterales bacterium]